MRTADELAEEVEVLAVARWMIHSGANWSYGGGIDGQVAKAKWEGHTFYVRENLRLPKPTFLMSSSERLGMKEGRAPKGSVEVLEVACDPEARAVIVERSARGRGRKVREHRRMTINWAEAHLKENR